MADALVIASIYRLTAVNFTESAKILNRAFQEKGESMTANLRAVPFYYLVSHAAEMFLKCALLKRGSSLCELKSRDLRHSLENLLDELLTRGVPISETSSKLLRTLNSQHEKHSLRYTSLLDDGEPTFTPQPVDLFVMLDELLMAGRIATHGV